MNRYDTSRVVLEPYTMVVFTVKGGSGGVTITAEEQSSANQAKPTRRTIGTFPREEGLRKVNDEINKVTKRGDIAQLVFSK